MIQGKQMDRMLGHQMEGIPGRVLLPVLLSFLLLARMLSSLWNLARMHLATLIAFNIGTTAASFGSQCTTGHGSGSWRDAGHGYCLAHLVC